MLVRPVYRSLVIISVLIPAFEYLLSADEIELPFRGSRGRAVIVSDILQMERWFGS